ncbi:MAG TPA: hypothetical protein VMB73_22365 [Acetobacteraceae bacterium]|nr:hypothetical protein [Acetobacteraceae bacterium]
MAAAANGQRQLPGDLASDTNRGANMENELTGRSVELREATRLAGQIVIARFESLGMMDFGAPGQAFYGDAQIEVDEWLKPAGASPQRDRHMTVSYTVQRLPAGAAEHEPELQRKYILFLVDRGGMLRAAKIMAADDATEQATRTVIAREP